MFGKIKRILKYTTGRESEIREEIEKYGGVEKKDIFAMVFSAYLVIMPVVILILLIFALVAYLFIG